MNRTLQLALLFKDMALLRLFGGSRRERRLRQITERLGLLHGLPQKIGQLLSFSELDSSSDTFTTLTENIPAMSRAEAAGEIEKQLSAMGLPPLRETFADLSLEGISASIGQVHQGRLHDGREVAVKVQYPGVADSLDHDLRSLGWLTAPVGDLRRGFDMAAYRNEIGVMLRTELDFAHEAASTTEFRNLVGADPALADQVETPAVIEELSGNRLLTTTWLAGRHFSTVLDWDPQQRESIAATLLRLFLRSCFDWRRIHADPHPGNYRFNLHHGLPVVGLLDFGCIKSIPEHLADGLVRLMTESPTEERALELHLQMGFNAGLLRPLHGRLAELSRILFAPFAINEPFDLKTWNIRDRVGQILGEDRMNYRLAGPPEMIYLLRSFQGLLHYLKALDTPVNWRGIFNELNLTVDSSQVPLPTTDVKTGMLAETLNISVMENGAQKVSLSFAASAAANLVDLVPQDLKPGLERRGIHLAEIASNASQSRFAPGELFQLQDGPKSVRVWLQ